MHGSKRSSQPLYTPGVKKDQVVVMRDGARISADVYRPYADGRFPALLAVSPYGKDLVSLPVSPSFPFRECGPIEWYVERGYAFVHSDVRGTGKSEGHFRPLGMSAQDDLYDLVEWVADQPWCDGKVGMIGAGAYGVNQWLAAVQNPPRLACIAPCDAMVDPYRDMCYHGGIVSLFISQWDFDVRARRMLDYPDRRLKSISSRAEGLGRRIATAPSGSLKAAGIHALIRAGRLLAATLKPGRMNENWLHGVLDNPVDGPFYWVSAAYLRFKLVSTPFYSIGNFASVGYHLRGNLLAFEEIDAPKKMLIHGVPVPAGRLYDTPEVLTHTQSLYSRPEFHEELLRWYDHWLKGYDTGIMDDAPVRYWVGGREEYRTSTAWPPPEVRYQPLYLSRGPGAGVRSLNDGALVSMPPSGEQEPTSISYPDLLWSGDSGLGTAVPTASGIPDRVRRILTFTSAPLEADLEIAGPICLKLYASSDQADTDFCVRLCDQPPLGEEQRRLLDALDLSRPATVVSRGWLKASHRELDPERTRPYRPWHLHQHPQPLERGQVYELDIEIWPAAWVFRQGHCIRLEMAPGDSPFFDSPVAHRYGLKTGTDHVHHGASHPSHVLLPVVG